MSVSRVLSGMRPTGWLHLGHYHGVLENWVRLQHEHDCYFFVADWHALTTHYDDPRSLAKHTQDMVIDWLAAGVDPDKATIFVQSAMPEHAELHVLLSMGTPLSWLERVPTYKDQQEKLREKDLATYGFLGYPLLQSADILLYRAEKVPVGADQVAHVELTREVARRFNHLYGREHDAAERLQAAIALLDKDTAKKYQRMAKKYQEQGDAESLKYGKILVQAQQQLSTEDRERLMGGLDGSGRVILPEPTALLTEASKMPGLDGQKMSKSYGNTISLRETPDNVRDKLRKMPTDPARVRRTDAGNPKHCPVWQLHEVYTDLATRDWVQHGCTSASIGCLECKQPVIDAINHMLLPMRERAAVFEQNPSQLNRILSDGAARARETAHETLREVRKSMGLIGSWSQ
jgi:tryptophanyl-tRNA synthetase